MDIKGINIDTGKLFSGIGDMAVQIRQAITGDMIQDPIKRLELELKMKTLENEISVAHHNIVLAESQSEDKWTSRGRPMFLYVIYILILASIPMGIVYSIDPVVSENIIKGFAAWLNAIPDDLYMLFGAGYLGYGAFRSWDKKLK
jgi:hypothetical protein